MDMKVDPLDRKKIFWQIEKHVPERQKYKALPDDKQEIFTNLCNLEGDAFRAYLDKVRS